MLLFADANVSLVRYYHHYSWIYICLTDVSSQLKNQNINNGLSDSLELPQVSGYIVVLVAKDFNPEKYEAMTKLLSESYQKSLSTARLLELYLGVVVEGSCSLGENGTFYHHDYEQKKIMATNSSMKQIIKTFNLDVILIYTALILKKRIVVYHHKLEALLTFIRALPAFIWHRQNWDDILYPNVDLMSKAEVDELKSLTHYVAGCTDNSIESKVDLYDIYVNLAAVEITVAHHAKDAFAMTKTHKEIAVLMKRQAEISSNSDLDIIKEIASKTKELISTLKSLAGSINEDNSEVVTLQRLKERKLAPALENFLWNLTVAEKLNSP